MGNSSSTYAHAAAPVKVAVHDSTLEQKQNARRIAHILEKVDDNGRVTCSCGMELPSRHYYNLHVESWNHLPANNTGWPSRHFEAMGSLRKCQRGVVSKGDLEHAMFTVLTLQKQNSLTEAVARQTAKGMHDFHDVLESVRAGAGSYVEKQDLGSVRLVGLVAASAEVWPVLDPSDHPPSDLHAFTPLQDAEGKVRFPKVATDIFILIKSNHKDLCVAATDAVVSAFGSCVSGVESFPGFRYKKGRDLTGFIDGTRNPDHLLRALADEALIFGGDQKHGERDASTADAHEGGSYMWAGRFVHDLAKFRSLPLQCKSAIIGRQYDKVSPHVGYDRRLENPHMHQLPGDSHVSRGHGAMYRQAYPYVAGTQKGLYFSCYSRKLEEIDRALRRMAGRHEGTPDRLLSITQAVSGNYYYVPSTHELAALKLWFRPTPAQQTNTSPPIVPQTDAAAVSSPECVPALPQPTVSDMVDTSDCEGATEVSTTLPTAEVSTTLPTAEGSTTQPTSIPTVDDKSATATASATHSANAVAVAVADTANWFEGRLARANAFLARHRPEHNATTAAAASQTVFECKTDEQNVEVRIEIEYCTNCGYNSVFYNMKRVLEATGARAGVAVTVVPNPRFPRQSAFEVKVVRPGKDDDDVTLWSKLALPDGRNNYSHCFPTELQIAIAFKHHLGVSVAAADEAQAEQQAGVVRGTIRNGVW